MPERALQLLNDIKRQIEVGAFSFAEKFPDYTVDQAMQAGGIRKDDKWDVAMDLWAFAQGKSRFRGLAASRSTRPPFVFFLGVHSGGVSMGSRSNAAARGLLVAAIVVSGLLLSPPAYAAESVGSTNRHYVDEHRRNWRNTGPRPLETAIWYPTRLATPAAKPQTGVFETPEVIADAPIADRGRKYPLVIISHGTGGCSTGMLWLGHYLASHGYIVAAANHHGNTCAEDEYDPRGFFEWWQRPQDLTAILDHLLADPEWAPRIDRSRIGTAGFSLGGYTVIAVSGGRIDRPRFVRYCGSPDHDFTCDPQPEFPQAPLLFQQLEMTDPAVQEALKHSGDSYRDPRIRATFAIAPVFGEGFTERDVADIKIPVQIVVGSGDTVAPPATNAKRFASLIHGAKLVVLPGEIGHYDFVPVCTAISKTMTGRPDIERLCHDAPGVNRGDVQSEVALMALRFFDKNLAAKRD